MIAYEESIDDETGAMCDYRHTWNHDGYLYSKSPLQQVQAFGAKEEDALLTRIQGESWGTLLKEVPCIRLANGVIFISHGSLIFERNPITV